MTRLPCNDSAGLLLGAASALLLGLAISPHSVLAEDLSPVRIKAATSAVDSAMIKANTATSQDWPTIGLDYAETRFSKLKQITSDNVKELGPVRSHSLGTCCCRQRGCESRIRRPRPIFGQRLSIGALRRRRRTVDAVGACGARQLSCATRLCNAGQYRSGPIARKPKRTSDVDRTRTCCGRLLSIISPEGARLRLVRRRSL
jgi:hypothetical protein